MGLLLMKMKAWCVVVPWIGFYPCFYLVSSLE